MNRDYLGRSTFLKNIKIMRRSRGADSVVPLWLCRQISVHVTEASYARVSYLIEEYICKTPIITITNPKH
jgi:hypothetical protein